VPSSLGEATKYSASVFSGWAVARIAAAPAEARRAGRCCTVHRYADRCCAAARRSGPRAHRSGWDRPAGACRCAGDADTARRSSAAPAAGRSPSERSKRPSKAPRHSSEAVWDRGPPRRTRAHVRAPRAPAAVSRDPASLPKIDRSPARTGPRARAPGHRAYSSTPAEDRAGSRKYPGRGAAPRAYLAHAIHRRW